MSHSTADGVAPRFVGASSWYMVSVLPMNQLPTTDSIRCEASISKTKRTNDELKCIRFLEVLFKTYRGM